MSDLKSNTIRILVVEDNDSMREAIVQILSKSGFRIFGVPDFPTGLKTIAEEFWDIVISDYKLPGGDGMDILRAVKEKSPQTEVLIMTAFGTIELAVEAMKQGAWDFITKPFSKDSLLLKVNRAAEVVDQRKKTNLLQQEVHYLRDESDDHFNRGEIVGESQVMKEIFTLVQKVAKNKTTVFISGESGTGKELIARAIHKNSPRKDQPFIRVNCSALAEGLLESELFGHEKGAFTGALRQKFGRFELAHGGTLFLDEIGDLPLSVQVKLLGVLQEEAFERVGGEETIEVDVRLITATHRNIEEAVRAGTFREDLYFRLHILPIHLPALRERKTDIPKLASHFLNRLGYQQGESIHLSEEGLERLLDYPWPGNIRELQNILERAAVLREGDTIRATDLDFLTNRDSGTKLANDLGLEARLEALEQRLLAEAMDTAKGVKARAARLLDIKEGALYYKLEKYRLLDKD